MKARNAGLTALLVITVLLVYASLFVVSEGQQAVLLQFGRVVRSDFAPGLHFKLPLVQQVVRFDDRVLSLDPQPLHLVSADRTNVNLDYYASWRVVDHGRFYQASQADVLQANQRLVPLINEALRQQVSTLKLDQLIQADAPALTEPVRQKVAVDARKQLGIDVIDVSVKRIGLPDDVDAAVYKRMRQERQQIANQLRADGAEQAAALKADTQKQVEQIKAAAERDAAQLRGEGDAQAAAIYAQAYQQDPDFYAFYRSLESYRKAFGNGHNVFVLKPDSDFLRYFNSGAGKH